jgi:tetratricopeptide (TPR) repeat protein
MTLATDNEWSEKRRLILRDTLTFLSLSLITAVLFVVTHFLFHSFASHREELAQRWSARGREALASGHPDQAIVALRTALSYAPGDRTYELLLAQSLADAGHTDEAYNYFLSLWETQPGDGFINLQLARLAASKKDMQSAINYYRGAIYGTWEGDGALRRREVRLELARYLIAHHDLSNARTELLVAGGNAQDDIGLTSTLAPLLEQAGAPADALNYYKKVLARDPDNRTALEAAGRLEYGFGNFEESYRLLAHAERKHTEEEPDSTKHSSPSTVMMDNAARLLALAPQRGLPPKERAARILKARDIAKKRFEACNAEATAARGKSSLLQTLAASWASKEANANLTELVREPSLQDATMKLVYDTEEQTGQVCGAPTGDDALLLLLAKSPKMMGQESK